MDARQRLLDALAEVEGLEVQRKAVTSMAFDRMTASLKLYEALHALLPTLSALKEVVEEHSYSMDDGVEYCDKCNYCKPCPTLETLARQFKEE